MTQPDAIDNLVNAIMDSSGPCYFLHTPGAPDPGHGLRGFWLVVPSGSRWRRALRTTGVIWDRAENLGLIARHELGEDVDLIDPDPHDELCHQVIVTEAGRRAYEGDPGGENSDAH